jgi:dTDP-4-dehydrorhamnose reductase
MTTNVKRTSLVVGASGQIGEHCLSALNSIGGMSALGTYKQHSRPGLVPLDVTDVREFDRVVKEHRPEVVYLTACVANVDYCEAHADTAYETNVVGVRNAVNVANQHGCKLVYMSSEYLFDGAAGPYDEYAAPRPVSVYGLQKLGAEHYIAAFANDWLIIRTTVVYSWESQGKNFLYRLRSSLNEGQQLRVPADQVSSPTYAPDLVQAMIQLVQQGERGVFNVAGSRIANRYVFALAAADAFGLDPTLIVPVATADLNQPARRPLNAGLIVRKVERALGRPMLDFSAGLRDMARTEPAVGAKG